MVKNFILETAIHMEEPSLCSHLPIKIFSPTPAPPKKSLADLRRELLELLDDYSLSPAEFRRRLDEIVDDEGGQKNEQ